MKDLAYHELIKSFKNIRSYMREFYVYGFKSREEYAKKSTRSYDNERRRMESWLGDYMSFRQDSNGKQVFLSVDSRNIVHNPLYQAFKAKSFTRSDLLLHFYLMDLLEKGESLCVQEVVQRMDSEYLSGFDGNYAPDESTVRKKLQEYEQLGLLISQKQGKKLTYHRDTTFVDLASWKEATAFFSEVAPLGVVGSYLLDINTCPFDYLSFKHHYMLHALDSEILWVLLSCMMSKCYAKLMMQSSNRVEKWEHVIMPLKIFASSQTGRQYVLGHSLHFRKLVFVRIDLIQSVVAGQKAENYEAYLAHCHKFMKHLWGVSTNSSRTLDHLEMLVHVEEGEDYIIQRLNREKRNGTVEFVKEKTYCFKADVYDAMEMLPWIRTFIGRIDSLTCSKQKVTDTFYADLVDMQSLYGDHHVIS